MGSGQAVARDREEGSMMMVDPFIVRAAILWKNGKDTRQIAMELRVPESEVWNRVEQIKARVDAPSWSSLA
jgi:hypothetical protein